MFAFPPSKTVVIRPLPIFRRLRRSVAHGIPVFQFVVEAFILRSIHHCEKRI